MNNIYSCKYCLNFLNFLKRKTKLFAKILKIMKQEYLYARKINYLFLDLKLNFDKFIEKKKKRNRKYNAFFLIVKSNSYKILSKEYLLIHRNCIFMLIFIKYRYKNISGN